MRPLTLALAALTLAGCVHLHQAAAGARVRRVALVQYAIAPDLLLNTKAAQEARPLTAAAAWAVLARELGFEVLPLAEMLANPAYEAAGGRPSWEGYATAPGARFFSADAAALDRAELPADTAKRLCEALGVDAVVAVRDRWSVEHYQLGFRARAVNAYAVSLYGTSGALLWSDEAGGESDEGMPATAGVLSADAATWARANAQAFAAALRDLAER